MNETVIDEVDRAIINLLQSNARLSAIDIASQLNDISPRMIRYRIEKLSQAGIISFTTIVHTKALGYPIQAHVFLRCESAQILNVVQQLIKFDQVTCARVVTGNQDVIITVIARSVEDFNKILLKEIQQLPGIHQTETHIVLEEYKDVYQWKIPDQDVKED